MNESGSNQFNLAVVIMVGESSLFMVVSSIQIEENVCTYNCETIIMFEKMKHMYNVCIYIKHLYKVKSDNNNSKLCRTTL